jgi:RNA-directed DNA polymerase
MQPWHDTAAVNECCRALILQTTSPTEWEQWLTATRKAITKHAINTAASGMPNDHQTRLIHAHCRQDHTRPTGNSPIRVNSPALPPRLA